MSFLFSFSVIILLIKSHFISCHIISYHIIQLLFLFYFATFFFLRVVWFDLDLSSTPYKTLKFHEKAVRCVQFHKYVQSEKYFYSFSFFRLPSFSLTSSFLFPFFIFTSTFIFLLHSLQLYSLLS